MKSSVAVITASRVRKPVTGSMAAASTGTTVPSGARFGNCAQTGVRSHDATPTTAAPKSPAATPSCSASRSGSMPRPASRLRDRAERKPDDRGEQREADEPDRQDADQLDRQRCDVVSAASSVGQLLAG